MIVFDVEKTFRSKEKNLHLHLTGQLDSGEIAALHGPSGVGKTTLLKMLAGLVLPDSGSIVVAGQTWFDSSNKVNRAIAKREIGFLFQDYALFPNMTVKQNIEYGMGELSDAEFTDRIIQITAVEDILALKPENLSGGQRQRVAFARAVVRKPSLLLLDEPLSALDAARRTVLQNELLELRKLLDVTILLTSHDVPEVFKLADKVMLIREGQIQQTGTPADVFTSGDKNVSAIGEFLSVESTKGATGQGKKMHILVDGKVVSVDLDPAIYE